MRYLATVGDLEIWLPERAPLPAGELRFALFQTADPGYCSTMQIPLTEGRPFTDDDRLDRDKCIVVNQQFIRDFFPNSLWCKSRFLSRNC